MAIPDVPLPTRAPRPHLGPIASPRAVWLNLGRTIAISNKNAMDSLRQMWERNATVDHARRRRQWDNDAKTTLRFGSFPQMAYDLGYDSVQNQFKDVKFGTMRPHSEIVILSRDCMHMYDKSSCSGGGGRMRTCPPPSLELRTGAEHERPCDCLVDGGDIQTLACNGAPASATSSRVPPGG